MQGMISSPALAVTWARQESKLISLHTVFVDRGKEGRSARPFSFSAASLVGDRRDARLTRTSGQARLPKASTQRVSSRNKKCLKQPGQSVMVFFPLRCTAFAPG